MAKKAPQKRTGTEHDFMTVARRVVEEAIGEKRMHHRMYGFICNPDPLRPRFRLCVLSSHATKSQWETDPNELAGAEALRVEQGVRAVIQLAFFNPTTTTAH